MARRAFLEMRWASFPRATDVWLVTAEDNGTVGLNARVLHEFTGDDMETLRVLVERIARDHNAALRVPREVT